MGGSEIVDQPVAERAPGGKVEERAPLVRHQRVEVTRLRAAEPKVPVKRGRYGRGCRTSRRQIWIAAVDTASPGVQFLYIADVAGPHNLARSLRALMIPALVA